jgi:hypothetical protein
LSCSAELWAGSYLRNSAQNFVARELLIFKVDRDWGQLAYNETKFSPTAWIHGKSLGAFQIGDECCTKASTSSETVDRTRARAPDLLQQPAAHV